MSELRLYTPEEAMLLIECGRLTLLVAALRTEILERAEAQDEDTEWLESESDLQSMWFYHGGDGDPADGGDWLDIRSAIQAAREVADE